MLIPFQPGMACLKWNESSHRRSMLSFVSGKTGIYELDTFSGMFGKVIVSSSISVAALLT